MVVRTVAAVLSVPLNFDLITNVLIDITKIKLPYNFSKALVKQDIKHEHV